MESDLSILENESVRCVSNSNTYVPAKYQKENWPDERLQIVWLVVGDVFSIEMRKCLELH